MVLRNLDGTVRDKIRIGIFEPIRLGKLEDQFARVEDVRRFLRRDLYQVSPRWFIEDVEYASPYSQHLHVLLMMEAGSYYVLDEGALVIVV